MARGTPSPRAAVSRQTPDFKRSLVLKRYFFGRLAERYATPLPDAVSRVAELEAKVNAHLEKWGSNHEQTRN